MKLLAIDTSAKVCSVALLEDASLLACASTNNTLTHSQTLMPMVDAMLTNAGYSLDDVDGFACAVGPGSFTGLRIGIAAVKGLAAGRGLPCVGVSTLAALGQNAQGFSGLICAAMDARCGQVYTATFLGENDQVTRLTPDEAISIEELQARLAEMNRPVLLVGDGAKLCERRFAGAIPVQVAGELLRHQQAVSVGILAHQAFAQGDTLSADLLLPVYLRRPQAEREREKKIKGELQ